MNHAEAMKLSQKTYFLMQCQSLTGVAFDSELAKKLYHSCNEAMKQIEDEVEPKLPTRELNCGETKAATPPAQAYKKDGSLTVHTENYYDDIKPNSNGILHGKKFGQWHIIEDNKPQLIDMLPMALKDQDSLKDWLMAQGWTPTYWNYKKDERGKFVRDGNKKLIKTSPKLHDKGNICPNLENLGNNVELVEPIIRWMSLRNRRSVIWNPKKESGWLANWRLGIDDRLSASSSGITNTHRQKHRVVANIPRITSVLGEEMRSLFTVPEGRVMVGYDAAGLESRVEAHWCYGYAGGVQYAEELLHGDIHSTNAGIFFGSKVKYDENGKAESKYRDLSKNGKYALTYGSQPPTLASTLGCPLGEAKELFDNFWQGNTALSQLKTNLVKHWEGRSKSSIICKLTGHRLMSRSEHSLVNLLFQHTGAIVMDLAGAFMDSWLGGIKYDGNHIPHYNYRGEIVKRVIYYHDEYQWECSPEFAEELGEMGRRSIIKAGQFLKFNVPLDADYEIGKSWKDTH